MNEYPIVRAHLNNAVINVTQQIFQAKSKRSELSKIMGTVSVAKSPPPIKERK